jgi:GNAT superfamily N-acetyltransferase
MVITERLLTGPAVGPCLEALASLRINIFREYPYLYDGRREDELNYLRLYMEDPDAFVISVDDAGSMVGAATGIPLCHENQALIDPLAGTSYPVAETFYVGELLFFPAYRNHGLGLGLITMVEEQVRSLGTFRYLTCLTVIRPDDHPLCPKGYVPIDRFLDCIGFGCLPGVTTSFSWKEIDGISREHPMQFRIKDLCQ